MPACMRLAESTVHVVSDIGTRYEIILESLSNEDGNVRKFLQNNGLSYRIQSLHVGMQPPGHFSAVVFRNRT